MKRFYFFLMICTSLVCCTDLNIYAQRTIYYVSNGGLWDNWDIYSYNLDTQVETRLTTDLAIDNHPSISHYDTNQIVFSSNRGVINNSEFNIFLADVNDIDGTAKQLTDFSHPGVAGQGPYPNRHPHWHPNGRQIIFTSKNRAVPVPDSVISECSHPTPVFLFGGIEYRLYEGMNVIEIDGSGNVTDYKALNPFGALSHFVGHPSFNHTGDKIVFTASIDSDGKNWEVYTVGYDPISMTLLPGTLEQVTSGPDVTSNPIKLSGGASFSYDDNWIIFNSTRTTGGNSQLFKVSANSVGVSVDEATRLTNHHGNDYVPEPLANGEILITSDLGAVSDALCVCTKDDTQGATTDLDVVRLHYDQDTLTWRVIVGTDASIETLLISDEVSWFCGTKPNLSSCTMEIRIMSGWTLWLEQFSNHIPDNILQNYGSQYTTGAQDLYHQGWQNLSDLLLAYNPAELNDIITNSSILESTFPGFNSPQFPYWTQMYDYHGRQKYVVPAAMHGIGLGDSCVFTGISDPGANDLSGKSFELMQNYPNPFDEFTTIDFELKEREFVQLKVFDMLGKEVATLVQGEKPKGRQSVIFHSTNLPGGIYYNSLQLKNSSLTRKMVLLKQK